MRFMVYEDNAGHYHWRLVGEDSATLAVSGRAFASVQEARLAAAEVHAHAGEATGAGD